ncbi:lamin tail domain-containing protein [Streptomyces brasiliensis]|uniref:LTD domain-containing protein n=1 Tax=Streptomyces brasiliensis TaxID=1954 RepID=A0A917ULP9_9ACTN|nr:lamin tail domain-containing protein [Streptomyces brasiliensis]GGJ66716.1 hypothetical protein GCM10010121_091730 [Streptomyces brasiliensis]
MSVSFPVSVRRLSAVAVAAASCVGAMALPASAAGPRHDAHRDQVAIGGVHSRSDRSLNGEWVEIRNNGRGDVNLSGWTLSDSQGHTYTFRRFWLDDRSTVRVHTGFGRDSSRDLYQNLRRAVWDERDTATLRDNRGRFIDATSWGYGRNDRSDDNRSHRNDRDDHHRDGGRRH